MTDYERHAAAEGLIPDRRGEYEDGRNDALDQAAEQIKALPLTDHSPAEWARDDVLAVLAEMRGDDA